MNILKFGTAGIRLVMGKNNIDDISKRIIKMDTNIISICTSAVADYLSIKYNEDISVAISYDNRNNSEKFAIQASSIFNLRGINSYVFDRPTSTPELSYYIRSHRNVVLGINITASHNTKEWNGYKVYNEKGCQIGNRECRVIESLANDYLSRFINDECTCGKIINYNSKIRYINNNFDYDNFFFIDESTSKINRSVIKDKYNKNNLRILYTNFHGTGIFSFEYAMKNLDIDYDVYEPYRKISGDFNFKPDPGDINSYKDILDYVYSNNKNYDIIIGTDPDANRVGILVPTKNYYGDYIYNMVDGNIIGAVLLDYIINNKTVLSCDNYVVKSSVTTKAINDICDLYGIELVEVPTGFRNIGELIDNKDYANKNFIFGVEESNGYLVDNIIRDKDGISAALLIIEMYKYLLSTGSDILSYWRGIQRKIDRKYNNEVLSIYKDEKFSIEDIERFLKEDKTISNLEDEDFNKLKMSVFKEENRIMIVYDTKYECESKYIVQIRTSGTENCLKLYLEYSAPFYSSEKERLFNLRNSFKEVLMSLKTSK